MRLSVGYLFLDVFWFAFALAMFELNPQTPFGCVAVLLVTTTTLGAGIGGLFVRMKVGAMLGAVSGLAVSPIFLFLYGLRGI